MFFHILEVSGSKKTNSGPFLTKSCCPALDPPSPPPNSNFWCAQTPKLRLFLTSPLNETHVYFFLSFGNSVPSGFWFFYAFFLFFLSILLFWVSTCSGDARLSAPALRNGRKWTWGSRGRDRLKRCRCVTGKTDFIRESREFVEKCRSLRRFCSQAYREIQKGAGREWGGANIN